MRSNDSGGAKRRMQVAISLAPATEAYIRKKAKQEFRSVAAEVAMRLERSMALEIENASEGRSSEALDSIPTNKRKENEYESF